MTIRLKIIIIKQSITIFVLNTTLPSIQHHALSGLGVSTLHQLQATLEHQPLYVELLQEISPNHPPAAQNVLATFETSGLDFLFPYPQLRPTYTSGVDVDLLMEPTRDFPGVIAPRVYNCQYILYGPSRFYVVLHICITMHTYSHITRLRHQQGPTLLKPAMHIWTRFTITQ